MEYLKIKNWDRWQTYRADRGQPPWIKIHRCVMRNPEWVSLTDAERGQLVAIWLLAADHGGAIPASPEVIKRLCFLDNIPNLNKFTDLGFIEDGWRQDGVTVASNGSQRDQPEAEAETEKRRVEKSRYSECVFLTQDEYSKLVKQFSAKGTENRIQKLNDYIMSKGKKYKSHYHTILTWERLDRKGNNNGKQNYDTYDATDFLGDVGEGTPNGELG